MWLPCGFHATFIRFPCDSRTIFCVSHTSFKRTLATMSCLPWCLFALFSHVASKPTDACCLHNEVIDSSNPCRNRVDTYVHWLQIWVVVLGVFVCQHFDSKAERTRDSTRSWHFERVLEAHEEPSCCDLGHRFWWWLQRPKYELCTKCQQLGSCNLLHVAAGTIFGRFCSLRRFNKILARDNATVWLD